MVLATIRYATTTTGITATNGWTEQQDSATTNTTAPLFGVWVGTRDLSGQSGVAQPTVDQTYAGTAKNNAWLVVLQPPVAPSGGGSLLLESGAVLLTESDLPLLIE